jgi:hypothetical protein
LISISISKFDRNKKLDPRDLVEFHKIQYNSAEFQLEEVLYNKNSKDQKSTEFID